MAKEKEMDMAVEMEEFDPEQVDTVTVSLDDGRELECVVLAIYEAGDGQYIALLPEEEVDEEESTVFLYRYYERRAAAGQYRQRRGIQDGIQRLQPDPERCRIR